MQSFAQTLLSIVRATDIVARIGGDEFIIIFTDINYEKIERLAQKTLDAINDRIDSQYKSLGVAVSIGIASYPNDGMTLETLLKNADNAMYQIKKETKNGYMIYALK